jgi:hypothetical protein
VEKNPQKSFESKKSNAPLMQPSKIISIEELKSDKKKTSKY